LAASSEAFPGCGRLVGPEGEVLEPTDVPPAPQLIDGSFGCDTEMMDADFAVFVLSTPAGEQLWRRPGWAPPSYCIRPVSLGVTDAASSEDIAARL